MTKQYERNYELIVITADGQVRTIRGLRIEFEITKSLISYPNIAKISIYNANEDTLSALQRKFTRIILNVGYGTDLKVLFKGEVRNVFQEGGSINKLLTIYSGDGEKDWKNSFFNKTYNKNVSIKTIITDLVNSFPSLTLGEIEGIPDVADNLLGSTISGKTSDILDRYATDYGFNWSIQDEQIIITPDDQALSNSEAVLINASNGMIGSPTLTETNLGFGGVEVTTLLNPRLKPTGLFKIESVTQNISIPNLFFREVKKTRAEGLYRTQEVVFKGDSRQGEWLSTAKGTAVNE